MATDQDKQQKDADLGGDYARDTHRGGFGDDYAREGDAPKDDGQITKDADIGKASE